MMKNARWVWCDERRPNTYCCVRRRFELPAVPVRGMLRLVADSRYRVWINGAYVGQGPVPFKPPFLYVDEYDVTSRLRTGPNVVAVLGNHHGVKHCTYTVGTPGVIAEVEVIDADGHVTERATDSSWKVFHLEAYCREVPRRTWATPWCEYYDARLEPTGWQMLAFDDSAWPFAREVETGPLKLLPRIVPPLEEFPINGVKWIGIWNAIPGVPLERSGDTAQSPGLTSWLDQEELQPVDWPACSKPGGCALIEEPMSLEEDESGTAIAVDLGEEITGHIEIDVECGEGTVIDLCPAETLWKNRPWCFRKEGEYARRYVSRSGRQQWRCFGYDGIRYIHAVIRGPHGKVLIHRLGAWRRQAALPIKATFECGDPVIDRIWRITCHSMRVGSQEIHIDCPTREQTSAWGDHVWSGLWAGYLTGDFSALRHLVLSLEQVQMRDGQLPCYPFASDHDISPIHEQLPLYDYSLIAVWGVWIYLQSTGDQDLASRVMPSCDRVLDWYRKQRGFSGLIELDGDAMWKQKNGQLFIDHPGLGSHNAPYPPLDRRGINAPLNCFFIQALDSQARILDLLGKPERARSLREETVRMRVAAEKLFFDPVRNVYVDGHFEGRRLEQISQQTNALAIIAGVCPPDRALQVLTRILDPSDSKLCRCGTYFWTYLAEALCMSGMHSAMWREVVRLWNEMAEKGATTWWETFLGDELDSLCHIWSCVPGYLILAEILGVKPVDPGFTRVDVCPRFDLLREASGSVPCLKGTVGVQWKHERSSRCELTVKLEGDVEGALVFPPGWATETDHRTHLALPPDRTTRVVAGNDGPIPGI